MQLRPYQSDLIQRAREAFVRIQLPDRKPRLMLQSGCGSGKTFIAANMALNCANKGGSSVFVVHRDFLLEQTSLTYDALGLPHSYISAGRQFDTSARTHIAMVGSMKSRMNKIPAPTICFIDEGHHGTAKTWSDIIKAWPETTFLFLSATPHRADKIGLDQLCDDLICGPSNRELIRLGALSDYHYFTPSKPDLSGVHVRMGEYVTSEVDEEMRKSKIVGSIVGSYKKHADGTRAVYFAASIATSKHYADAFNGSGIRAIHLDADSSASERKQAAIDMAMGRLQVICNVGLFGEGFDLAAHAGMPVTIETVGLCRPTKSLPLLIQQQMRCMRAKDYPGIILDHAGCYDEHDFLPDDDIEWSLKGGKRNETVATFQCVGCGAVLRRGAGACSYCGTDNSSVIADVKARKEALHVSGELERVERENRIRQDQIARGTARTLEDLIKFGREKGYSNPVFWAKKVYAARQGKRRGY